MKQDKLKKHEKLNYLFIREIHIKNTDNIINCNQNNKKEVEMTSHFYNNHKNLSTDTLNQNIFND
jgi:hypothetical protein